MTATVYVGDVRDALHKIEEGTIRAVVTSPPYFGLRVYSDDEREMGRGTFAEWVHDLVDTFADITPLLTDDAVVWLNVGDAAAGSGGAGGDHNRGGSKTHLRKYRQGRVELPDGSTLPGGQWIDAPGRLLHALQNDGWYCRSQIVWVKPIKPEAMSHTRRPGISHEMVYMLTRTPNQYAFDGQDLAEKGNVWHIKPGGRVPGAKAPMPLALAVRCLTAMGITEGLVLDPFMGSGTTLEAAQFVGLDGVGIDLDEEAATTAAARLNASIIRV